MAHIDMSHIPIQVHMPSGIAIVSSRGQQLVFVGIVVDSTHEKLS